VGTPVNLVCDAFFFSFGSTSGEQGWLPRAVRWPRDLLFFFKLMIECFWNIVDDTC
jgi:hypothetical protein